MKQVIAIDRLGNTLTVGDRVAYASYHNLGLTVGTIVKLGRTNATVDPGKAAWNTTEESFHFADVIKV